MEWHAETGLVATMIEAPLELQQKSLPLDRVHFCPPSGTEISANVTNEEDSLPKTPEKASSYMYVPVQSSPIFGTQFWLSASESLKFVAKRPR
jgi:hypothetical protein